jgi:endo-1,3-1,4-beta-glycanase ExoK
MPLKPVSVMAALLAALASQHAPAAAQEAFFEPFDVLDRGRWLRSDGWSNGDWMNCDWSRDAARVSGGVLVLEVRATDAGLICGELQTTAVYGYGTYEVRMRTGAGSGLNAAFFTYIGPVHDRAHHEIDIEVLLRNPGAVTFNTFFDGAPFSGAEAALGTPSDAEFTSYAFTWAPDGISWFVNGAPVHRTEPGAPIPEPPQKIYTSLWSSNSFPDWMGRFDDAALPSQMFVDWIAFTPLEEPCQFAQSVLCAEG